MCTIILLPHRRSTRKKLLRFESVDRKIASQITILFELAEQHEKKRMPRQRRVDSSVSCYIHILRSEIELNNETSAFEDN